MANKARYRPTPAAVAALTQGLPDDLAPTVGARPPIHYAELQRWLRVSRMTMYRMVQSGQLPEPVSLTSKIRVWPADVILDWLKGHNYIHMPVELGAPVSDNHRSH